MKVNINEVVKNTNQALNDLKQLDASNWTNEDKEEVLEDVEEVIKLGLLAKWKVQTAYLKQSVEDLDINTKDLDISNLQKATSNLEYIVSNIKALSATLKSVA